MATTSPAPQEIRVSEELSAPVSANVELCYQTYGDPADDAILLVMGLGGPMTWWDPEFCKLLASKGFFVIRYDNRDTGKSSRISVPVPRHQLVRAFAGQKVRAPYSLTDLANDGFALLDHLGIDAAHAVGVSMGGMIVQTMAIENPARVRSLVSIMSTTGKRTVGWQDPRLLPTLIAPRSGGRDAYVDTSSRFWAQIGSPAYPQPVEKTRDRAGVTYDRGFSPAGVMRQMLAVLTQPNRSVALRSLRIPAMVIHGLNDRMVHVSGGRATSTAIPGSELLLVDGMGHDIPPQLFDTIADAIQRTARRA